MNQPKSKIESPLVGPEVIAGILSVSRNTVLNWARNGKIPCIRIEKTYRFSLKIISDFTGHIFSYAKE